MTRFYIPCFVLGDKYFAGTRDELKAFVDDKERMEKYVRFCANGINSPIVKFINKMLIGVNVKRMGKMIRDEVKGEIKNCQEDKVIWILYRSIWDGQPTIAHSTNEFDDEMFEYALQREKEACKS